MEEVEEEGRPHDSLWCCMGDEEGIRFLSILPRGMVVKPIAISTRRAKDGADSQYIKLDLEDWQEEI